MLAAGDPSIETHVSKLTNLPFDDNQFDLTICLHVIRHNDPDIYDQIINELCRVSDKYVLILNPFIDDGADIKQMFKTEVWDLPMTIENLDNMMNKNGFCILFTKPVSGDPKKIDSFVLYKRN